MRNSFYWFHIFLTTLIGQHVATGAPKVLWAIAAALSFVFFVAFQVIEQLTINRVNKKVDSLINFLDDQIDKRENKKTSNVQPPRGKRGRPVRGTTESSIARGKAIMKLRNTKVNGQPMSYAKIAKKLGINTGTVAYYVKRDAKR